MKRRLSTREITLLLILLVLALGSAYYLWFFTPMQEEQASVEAQIQNTQDEINTEMVQIAQMRRMEEELEQLFAENPNPVRMAQYDNIQNVMFELNAVLARTNDYSLSFEAVESGQGDSIVRRNISLTFECYGYDKAKEILQELHDSKYRCMLKDLDISISERQSDNTAGAGVWWLDDVRTFSQGAGISGQGNASVQMETEPESGVTVSISATITFFEYQPKSVQDVLNAMQ